MNVKTLFIGCLGGLLSLNSCSETTETADYSAYVNPFIGTGGHGHTFPGAVVPHGMIQPSPDTRIDGWDACSGYYYADSTINGFSHTYQRHRMLRLWRCTAYAYCWQTAIYNY